MKKMTDQEMIVYLTKQIELLKLALDKTTENYLRLLDEKINKGKNV